MGILCLVKPEPSYSKNDADVTFENIAMARRKNGHPPLPLERPPWRWDKNVPSAKAEFIFWDSKNQCDVYACRTCFKKFNNGSARFWHERQIEVCSKEAHFPYYTSEYYIKQNSKSKHRRWSRRHKVLNLPIFFLDIRFYRIVKSQIIKYLARHRFSKCLMYQFCRK